MLGPALPKQQKMGDNENDDQAQGAAVVTKAATQAARQRKEEEGDLAAQKGLRNIVAVIGSVRRLVLIKLCLKRRAVHHVDCASMDQRA